MDRWEKFSLGKQERMVQCKSTRMEMKWSKFLGMRLKGSHRWKWTFRNSFCWRESELSSKLWFPCWQEAQCSHKNSFYTYNIATSKFRKILLTHCLQIYLEVFWTLPFALSKSEEQCTRKLRQVFISKRMSSVSSFKIKRLDLCYGTIVWQSVLLNAGDGRNIIKWREEKSRIGMKLNVLRKVIMENKK